MTRALMRAYGPHPDEDSPGGVRAELDGGAVAFWTEGYGWLIEYPDPPEDDPETISREIEEEAAEDARDAREADYDDWMRGRGKYARGGHV